MTIKPNLTSPQSGTIYVTIVVPMTVSGVGAILSCRATVKWMNMDARRMKHSPILHHIAMYSNLDYNVVYVCVLMYVCGGRQ